MTGKLDKEEKDQEETIVMSCNGQTKKNGIHIFMVLVVFLHTQRHMYTHTKTHIYKHTHIQMTWNDRLTERTGQLQQILS